MMKISLLSRIALVNLVILSTSCGQNSGSSQTKNEVSAPSAIPQLYASCPFTPRAGNPDEIMFDKDCTTAFVFPKFVSRTVKINLSNKIESVCLAVDDVIAKETAASLKSLDLTKQMVDIIGQQTDIAVALANDPANAALKEKKTELNLKYAELSAEYAKHDAERDVLTEERLKVLGQSSGNAVFQYALSSSEAIDSLKSIPGNEKYNWMSQPLEAGLSYATDLDLSSKYPGGSTVSAILSAEPGPDGRVEWTAELKKTVEFTASGLCRQYQISNGLVKFVNDEISNMIYASSGLQVTYKFLDFDNTVVSRTVMIPSLSGSH